MTLKTSNKNRKKESVIPEPNLDTNIKNYMTVNPGSVLLLALALAGVALLLALLFVSIIV